MPIRRVTAFVLAGLLLASGYSPCLADRAVTETGPPAATRDRETAGKKPASFAARAVQSFTKTVRQNFEKWDRNGDGRLSAGEVDRLIADPRIKGFEAAAIASIHRYLRSDGAPPAVTLSEVLKNGQQEGAAAEAGNSQEPARHDVNDGKPRFVACYARFVAHLKKAPRDLFTDNDGPTLEGIRQGSLGDCFFMCVIGATVSRDPQTIRKMLRSNPDGTSDVRFPSIGVVHVGRLTDGEIALTSDAADQGIWINVLEKAFGEVKFVHPKTKHQDGDIDLDSISRGGKILTTIQLMTGHKAFVIPIRHYKNKKLHKPTNEEIPRIMKRLDSAFSKAFATNRLVCADIATGVTGKDIPPGLVGRHAYAVLGYDQATHMVTVWNPHGKNYTPKMSPPSRQHGYPVKKGVFQMSLADFVRVFKAVTYETSASLARTVSRSERAVRSQ